MDSNKLIEVVLRRRELLVDSGFIPKTIDGLDVVFLLAFGELLPKKNNVSTYRAVTCARPGCSGRFTSLS